MNRMTARLICAALAGALALSAAGCGKKKESADSAQGAAGGSGAESIVQTLPAIPGYLSQPGIDQNSQQQETAAGTAGGPGEDQAEGREAPGEDAPLTDTGVQESANAQTAPAAPESAAGQDGAAAAASGSLDGQPEVVQVTEVLLTLLETAVQESYGSDHLVRYEGNGVTAIYLWREGLTAEVVMAAGGDAISLEKWDDLKALVQPIATSAYEVQQALGIINGHLAVCVLNDISPDKALITYVDGEMTYDVLDVLTGREGTAEDGAGDDGGAGGETGAEENGE